MLAILWVNGWVYGWLDGWVYGWMGGWMVEIRYYVNVRESCDRREREREIREEEREWE